MCTRHFKLPNYWLVVKFLCWSVGLLLLTLLKIKTCSQSTQLFMSVDNLFSMWYACVENSDIWWSSLLLPALHMCRRHGKHQTGFQRLPRHHPAHAPAPVWASMIRLVLSLAQSAPLTATHASVPCCRRARPGPGVMASCTAWRLETNAHRLCIHTDRLCLCCPRIPALLAGLLFCCYFGLFVCPHVLASCSCAICPADGALYLLFLETTAMFVCS